MTKSKTVGTTRTGRKRQAILEAAAELFLRQGYPGTSMDEIAARAAVSKQTVYAQFSSKEALFVAMVLGMTHAAGDQVQHGLAELPAGTSLADHLVAYAARQVEVARTPQLMQLRRLVIAETDRFPELGKAVYEGGPARAIAGLAAAFARWNEQGLIRAPEPEVAASNFNWLIMGDPVNRAMLLGDAAVPASPALRRHAREAVRVFMAAYGPE
ncbi:TetR/AcrR family transcriptional regulator [Sphingomonas cavernae]|uniref:TetR family transcriptional regulator n=1 Tax=Sphingomonas cavernae TaxID=2320861 RepID=A0A418W7G7_9SPHN|nr:TetR/AcrR family transcriptional regulator [Sphingomonas cavernae]RJF85928.1 TetR family transcriptional regulator [Sphingomonas cavernae]